MKRPAWLFFLMLALIIILTSPAVSPETTNAQAVEPVISGISPDTASGGTGSEITITGTGFGDSPGAVQFLYLNTSPPEFSPGQIISWSDTSIRLIVPPVLEGNEAYTDWPSSGPVKVVTAEGIESEGYPFRITFVYAGRKWAGNNPVVNFYINPNTADCEGEELAVQRAMAVWSAAAGQGFTYHYAGATPSVTATRNGFNEILWRDLGDNSMMARVNKHYAGNTIQEVDIEFNDHHVWSTAEDTPDGQRDVETIALHELGHALGLEHLHGDYPGYPQDTDKIMYGYGMSEGRNQRSPGSGDIEGIRWIYPEVQVQYTITASAGPGGSISPSGILRVEPGSSQSFSIRPDTGYVIADVLVDGDSIGPVDTYSFLNVDADHTIEVIFSPEECTLTINVTGEGEVIRNIEGPYHYGQVIRLTARPSPGWRFDHWEGDLSGSGNPVDITMSVLMSVTAVFSLIDDPVPVLSVSTVGPSNVGPAGAVLNGRLVSMGDNDAVQVYFEWGLSQEYGQTTEPQELAEPGNFSRLITGLEVGKNYHYRAVAVGQEGVITGSDVSFIPRVRPLSGGGGGGGGSQNSSRTISLKGLTSSPTLVTDNSGKARSSVQLKDSNGKVILDIVKGTALKDSLNKALRTISARILPPDEWKTDEYPLHEIVPDEKILEEYLFEPGGAMFNPALTLKVSYDPVGLPGGVDESRLYLACFDGTRWEKLDSQVDIGFHTVSAKINHFSRYALVGHIPPPAPASFSLSPVRVLPDMTGPESPVKVLAMVSNTGGMPGAYLAVLKVDGKETDAKLIYLEAGQNAAVEFILQRDIPAAYQVEINGNPASFTVISPPIPKPSASPAQSSAFISAQGDVNKPGIPVADKSGKPLPDTGTAFFVLWIIIAVVIVVGMVAGAIITRRRAF